MDKISDFEKQFKNDINTWHFHSKTGMSKDKTNIIEGRIRPDLVLSLIKQDLELKHSLHFICGPLGLKDSVKSALKSLSVPGENIFSEDFEITKKAADFDDIYRQTVE